jgi:hypothetical protein
VGELANVFDEGDFTEVFRRLSGFLAMVSGMVEPRIGAAEEDRKAAQAHEQALFVLDRLIQHLRCHESYYAQTFLVYIARQTANQAIHDFVRSLIVRAVPGQQNQDLVNRLFDVDRVFVSRQQLIVPGFDPLPLRVFLGEDEVVPTVIESEVPCDGVHLEVAQGACVLTDVPTQASQSIQLSIKEATLSAEDC